MKGKVFRKFGAISVLADITAYHPDSGGETTQTQLCTISV